MNHSLLLSMIIVGSILLYVYYTIFSKESGGYINSRFWVGIPKSLVKLIVTIQFISLIGFILAYFTPSGLIFGDSNNSNTTILTTIFLLAIIAWAFLVKRSFKHKRLLDISFTVISLVLAGLINIVLLLDAIESKNTITAIGLQLLALTTVLSDGIIWNSMFIKYIV